MLDKKIDIRLYSIVVNNNEWEEIFRVKKTFSISKNTTEVSQEKLNKLEFLFNDLGIDEIFEANAINKEFTDYCNQQKFLVKKSERNIESKENINTENFTDSSQVESNTNSKSRLEELNSKILYVNQFNVRTNGAIWTVNYIIEVRNCESEIIDIFYKLPVLSYLRMVLDYFFIDYFEQTQKNVLKINSNGEVNKKYNENSLQFNRRITRLFYGKLQDILIKESDTSRLKDIYVNKSNNQYYISDLFEKIDDISNHTYEGISPFGSILFFSPNVFSEEESLLEFTLKFQMDDLISLSDSKLIRKLLEITSEENDLYLLADHEQIYGLGRINWNQLKESLVFKLDFKGLSKYDIHLVTTKENQSDQGDLVSVSGKKVYKTTKQLEIINKSLLKISFKSAHFGGDGYTGDKFKRLLKSEYFNSNFEISNETAKYLDEVIMQAREQKHGTMVVITDYETAVSELKTLKKQAISIETTEISPEYIQFLTSIDGAIYFDNNGKCHAIGVILDGLAKNHIGDSSRGARYNSAYRYLEKLKEQEKKCLIVIISEDGIVNLIPEPENEEKIYALFQQLIDLLKEDDLEAKESELKELEALLFSKENIDYHLFFQVAEVYRGKENFDQAIKYYEKGISFARQSTISVRSYRYLANLYFDYSREDSTSRKEKIELSKEAKKYFEEYMTKLNQNELSIHDYNNSAINLQTLGDYSGNIKERHDLYQKSLRHYTAAIQMNSELPVLFSNRSILYRAMGMLKETLQDLIKAEFLSEDSPYSESIIDLLKENNELTNFAVESIINSRNDRQKSKSLFEKLVNLDSSLIEKYPKAISLLK